MIKKTFGRKIFVEYNSLKESQVIDIELGNTIL